MNDVFISYSRKDTATADRICEALDRAGISYFIDRQGIGGGFEFPAVLAQNIVDSRLFLLIASKNAYESRFTNSEVFFAFNKLPRNSMLPYIIDDAPMPLDLEFSFSGINWRRLDTHPIEPVLINDLLTLLGRPKKDAPKPTTAKVHITIGSGAPKPTPAPTPKATPDPRPAPAPAPKAAATSQPTTVSKPAPDPAPKPTSAPKPVSATKPAPVAKTEQVKSKEQLIKEWTSEGLRLYNNKKELEALPYFRKAAEAGDPYSLYMAGRIRYENAKDGAERYSAEEDIKKAADQDIINALLWCAEKNLRCKKNTYLIRAAELGNVEALHKVIKLLDEDRWTLKFESSINELAKALEILQESAEEGNVKSRLQLAKLVIKGFSVEKNLKLAAELLEPLTKIESAIEKNPEILYYYGFVLAEGDDRLKQDLPQAEAIARDLYNNRGHKSEGASVMFRVRYHQKRYREAIELYDRLKHPGYSDLLLYSEFHTNGLGVPVDYKQAKEILLKAEAMAKTWRSGEVTGEASYRIARLYLDGHLKDFLTKPLTSAIKYLSASERLGYRSATQLLASL